MRQRLRAQLQCLRSHVMEPREQIYHHISTRLLEQDRPHDIARGVYAGEGVLRAEAVACGSAFFRWEPRDMLGMAGRSVLVTGTC